MFGRFRAPAHQKFPDACLSCRWHGRLGPGLFPHDNAELIWKYAGKCRRRVGKADADKRRAILEGMAEVWSRLATKPSKKDHRMRKIYGRPVPLSIPRAGPSSGSSRPEAAISAASRDHTCAICNMAALVCVSAVARAISKHCAANQRYSRTRPMPRILTAVCVIATRQQR